MGSPAIKIPRSTSTIPWRELEEKWAYQHMLNVWRLVEWSACTFSMQWTPQLHGLSFCSYQTLLMEAWGSMNTNYVVRVNPHHSPKHAKGLLHEANVTQGKYWVNSIYDSSETIPFTLSKDYAALLTFAIPTEGNRYIILQLRSIKWIITFTLRI